MSAPNATLNEAAIASYKRRLSPAQKRERRRRREEFMTGLLTWYLPQYGSRPAAIFPAGEALH